MNEAGFSIHTPTDNVLRLEQAVLLYHGRSGGSLATVHDVVMVDGAPIIGAGRPMSAKAARVLASSLLKRAAHGGFLPETVLYLHGDVLMWWVPPTRRHLSFRVGDDHAQAFGGQERGAAMPMPGLIFAASSNAWQVWAVKGHTRPTLTTPLYRAPFFNVYEDGGICQGSAPRPEGSTVDKIQAWNEAFFRSYFTHPNVTAKLVRYAGGSYAFWRDMLNGRYKRFPERVLVDAGTTLGKLLGHGERDQ
ncbi:PRTRC system protein B [Aquabacterium sp.]|uniref:PRTRC system protein B n=1 Tax=Aquabacterium sp. TaxID=1872578 RepID=UPI004037B3E1